MAEVAVFTLLYLIISLCFVFKTTEFVSAGITVENLFERILGSEGDHFIQYHIRRTCLTLILHSIIPFGYLIGLSSALGSVSNPFPIGDLWWRTFSIFSVVYPFVTAVVIWWWSRGKWSNHPIVRSLSVFCAPAQRWQTLASDINSEYKRHDKIILRPSTLVKVAATDNWLMRVGAYTLQLVHQSDCVLVATSADTHEVSTESPGPIQYVNIEVKSTRPGIKAFYIRCKALEFQDLQDKVQRPIVVLDGVQFHRTTLDHFLEIFRETVAQNPPYTSRQPPGEEETSCAGCMVAQPNVKLVKHCTNEDCVNCYCRPMWCINCMGTWFASRQEDISPDRWLASKCTCPMCRSIFCVLDVCPVAT